VDETPAEESPAEDTTAEDTTPGVAQAPDEEQHGSDDPVTD
jgi:hypothetical protein